MTDADFMPWGTHKGKPIGEVPFDYLLKWYRKMWIDGEVLIYFENCLRVLEEQEVELNFKNPQKAKKYLIENYECAYPHKTPMSTK
ncbi:MAG TPA: hypothetical protein VGC65_00350 [Bacteroidia bacterium]|jgi:uncharacterized protein (DUF3820 family)